jgi:ribonuclease T2
MRRLFLLVPALLLAQSANFDYYVLSLSWAPDFCAQPGEASSDPQECAPGKKMGFVVHGLWPEVNSGHSPENCGKATKVSKGIINQMLPYMPSASLIQHEWATHGTCSGLSQSAFFNEVLSARSAVQIPVQFTSLEETISESPEQIEGQFASANTSFPAGAFRTACKSGALAEVRVCFDKNLKPQACTASPGECTTSNIQIRPPQ